MTLITLRVGVWVPTLVEPSMIFARSDEELNVSGFFLKHTARCQTGDQYSLDSSANSND